MKYLVGAAVVILALSTYGALQLGPPPHLPHMTNAERIDLSRPLPKRQFATINAALDGCRNSNGGSQINQAASSTFAIVIVPRRSDTSKVLHPPKECKRLVFGSGAFQL